MDRIAPSLKSTAPPIHIELPESASLTDTAKGFITAAANGELAPDISAQLISAVASIARVEEIENLKARLESLERAMKSR